MTAEEASTLCPLRRNLCFFLLCAYTDETLLLLQLPATEYTAEVTGSAVEAARRPRNLQTRIRPRNVFAWQMRIRM